MRGDEGVMRWDVPQRIGVGLMVCGLVVFLSGDVDTGPVALGLFLLGAVVYGVANLGGSFER